MGGDIMAVGYSEIEIRQEVKKLLNRDLPFFYKENILNYRGKTIDQGTLYSEVIADELINNYEQLSQLGKGVCIRETETFDRGHNGKPNVEARIRKFGKITFSEKLLAIALFDSKITFKFGKIFDYQVPLKENQADGFGEIDLVALDNSAIKLIELKIKGKSEETLLRALLEVYTYYKILKGSLDKFIQDYELASLEGLYFQPCIITDSGALSGQTLNNLKDYPCTIKLIDAMTNETGIPTEFYTYEYPAQNIKYRSDTNKHIDLVGDIKFNKIEL